MKIIRKIYKYVEFFGLFAHKAVVHGIGILMFILITVSALVHRSLSLAVDGEVVNPSQFDILTTGWLSYVLLAMFVCWLVYLVSLVVKFFNKRKKE